MGLLLNKNNYFTNPIPLSIADEALNSSIVNHWVNYRLILACSQLITQCVVYPDKVMHPDNKFISSITALKANLVRLAAQVFLNYELRQ